MESLIKEMFPGLVISVNNLPTFNPRKDYCKGFKNFYSIIEGLTKEDFLHQFLNLF